MFSLITAPETKFEVQVCAVSGADVRLQDLDIKLEDNQCVAFDSSCTGTVLNNITFTGVDHIACSMYIAVLHVRNGTECTVD